ncbi:AraC-like DNA-binding protein/quercetin dioxygenase-like cupin family protein [Metabacillus crassostreae]|uniref:helix-turn-helix domain-containing protein n=1 Tax=Metabacillus crassostreae TaxID=929098 RepID=UPI001956024B|nr:AraC family transcriptional regulator [Metabacillus crassostreae]MBM7603853.1 AraC-like DNA-binding protein/quercetin dioxygenase-like cupin family protein [Metabacillus crassostreae]
MYEQQAFKEYTFIPDKTFPLNIFKVSPPNGTGIPLHCQEHLEFILIRKGMFKVQIQDQLTELNEGDLLFINANEIHGAYSLSEGSELISIVFNDALIRNLSLDSTEKKYVLPIINHELTLPSIIRAKNPVAEPLTKRLEDLYIEFREKKKGFELFIKANLIHSIALIYRLSEEKLDISQNKREDTSIQNILIHLSENFQNPISITKAATICNLSPNYFCYVFKKTTGKTFVEYVNMLRVHEADRLLREGYHSISEVAYKVGYSNLTYFGRVFKQYKTCRPSDVVKEVKEAMESVNT